MKFTSKPVEEWTREELQAAYLELQLRVTRFSSTEQELINTRDKLDTELELYKRLQQHSSDTLEVKDKDALINITIESIIDILDIEASLVYFHNRKNPDESFVVSEGLKITAPIHALAKELKQISEQYYVKENQFFTSEHLSTFEHLSWFSSLIINSYQENELGYDLYIAGGVSTRMEKSYSIPDQKQINIFRLLSHQTHSVLAKLFSIKKIEGQIITITQSENELRKLSLIATKTKSGVVITDSFGYIEWVNEAFTNISGYTLDEVVGKKPKEFLQGPDTSDETIRVISEALSQKKDIQITVINYTKKGKPWFNQLEIISVFDESGKHINFISIQKDITSEIKYNAELVSVNNRFKLVSESSRIGIWEWDMKNTKFSTNEILREITGKDLAGMSFEEALTFWRQRVHPEDIESFLSNFSKLQKGEVEKYTHHYRFYPEGQLKPIYFKSTTVSERDPEGNIVKLTGGIQDVTSEKELQQQLQEALRERDSSLQRINVIKNFYENVLRYSPSEVLVFDDAMMLTYSSTEGKDNNSAWNIPVNTSLFSWMKADSEDPHHKILQVLSSAVADNKLIQVEDVFTDATGKQVVFLRSILPIRDDSGKLLQIIVIGVDITEQNASKKELLNKNEELRKINMELDNFVYSISHDLRSPLLSIKGLTELVLQTDSISEENSKLLHMVLNSAGRLDSTIQEILEYSRNSRLNVSYSSFDLADMIETLFGDLKYLASNPPTLKINTIGSSWIKSDKPRMGVLLKNILGNSLKYQIKDRESLVNVDIIQSADNMVLKIQDNGEGIAPRHLKKVFDMFYRGTTTSVGTGLGLYICREIVNKLGGTISIESAVNNGTTVIVTLPINNTQPHANISG